MLKNTFEDLNDAELAEKQKKMKDNAKISAIIFSLCLLTAIGYAGYAHGKGYEQPFSVFKSGWVVFFAGIHLIIYSRLSKIKKEIAQREN